MRGRTRAVDRRAARSALVRVLGALAVVGALVLGPAQVASAHAELSTSNPADGSVVEVAPTSVTLQFTEGIDVQPDSVRVIDSEAQRIDEGTATASDSTVTVPLKGDVPDGGYAVSWRVVSADGHPVHGAFQFFVGSRTTLRDGLADEAFAGSADGRDEVAGAVLRGIGYVAVLGVAGAVWVGAALRRDDEPPPVGRFVGAVTGVGLAAALLQLPIQASLATGQGWSSITEPGVLELALADGVGWSLAITGAGLLALLVTAGLPFRGAARVLGLVGAALAPLGLVVTGHTRTMSPAVVGYAADAAHVVAGAVWFGGLAALLVVVRRRRRAGDASGAVEAVSRFSGWAGLAVAAVIAAGTTLGWIEVGGWHALTSTTYGRLLFVKVALVGLVLAGAAWNRFRLIPSVTVVDRDDADADVQDDADPDPVTDPEVAPASAPVDARSWRLLTGIIRFEVVGLLVVLALTAVLANVTPARTAVGAGVVSVRAPLGGGAIEVLVDPARPGRNDIHVYFLDADGGVDDRFDTARFELAYPAQGIGPLDRAPVRAGPGHFQLVGTDLDLAGEWTLTVTVKTDRFTEQAATVTFRVE